MDFIPKRKETLERMCLVTVAALLWHKPETRVLVREFIHSDFFTRLDDDHIFMPVLSLRRQKWQNIENQILDKVIKLILPISLKDVMLSFVQPMGEQLLKWVEYHIMYYCLDLDLPPILVWTPQGTINKQKTAAVLVKNPSIDIITRYKLACIYCLEGAVKHLYNRIPLSQRNFVYSVEDPSKSFKDELMVFWECYVKGETSKMDKMILHLFKSAAESGNKAAAKYFSEKLNPRQKHSLSVTMGIHIAKTRFSRYPKVTDPPKEYQTEVLCFLMHEMYHEQQMQMFQTCPREVLCCFLDWPWQSFYVEIAARVWVFLPISSYHIVFRNVLHKVRNGCKDYNYKNVFRDLWQQVPVTDKSYILNDDKIADLLDMLLEFKHEENFKLIFRDTTLLDKHKLIFSSKGLYLCKKMIRYDQWDLLKYFIQLLISSRDEMKSFKKEFEKYVQEKQGWIRIDKYDKLFRLLDNLVHEYDKRKIENETDSSSVKRLCDVEFKH